MTMFDGLGQSSVQTSRLASGDISDFHDGDDYPEDWFTPENNETLHSLPRWPLESRERLPLTQLPM